MIVNLAVSLVAVIGFGLALWRTRPVPVARNAIRATMAGISSMTDSELDDDSKEVAVRRAGISLILASFSIFWRFLLALAIAAIPILLADMAGLASRDSVFALMLRWDYIVVVSVAAVVLGELLRRRRPVTVESGSDTSQYALADRIAHVMAFSSPAVLKSASRIEDRLLGMPAQDSADAPIFITSLARAGTTALLNAMHDMAEIATHTYRDMPFLTAPSLWNRIAGGKKRGVDRRERAHGDGLEIDLDSPEAFEEIIWQIYWPEKYHETHIEIWGAEDRKPHAEEFLKNHMSKVVRARREQSTDNAAQPAHYCSKNNANIARIQYLLQAFPKAKIVVPIRRPECHAASLLRQHENFNKLQSEDSFVRRYMRDIGHFDFGLLHKPIQFPGFDPKAFESRTGDYWLSYWIHAGREILRHRDSCIFVLQDDLRSSPEATMQKLCGALRLSPSSLSFSDYFLSKPDRSRTDIYDQFLLQEAEEVYREFEKVR